MLGMSLVRSTFTITAYALIALGVVFFLITLALWFNALYWGDALAEAIVWSVFTALIVTLHAGVDRMRARGA